MALRFDQVAQPSLSDEAVQRTLGMGEPLSSKGRAQAQAALEAYLGSTTVGAKPEGDRKENWNYPSFQDAIKGLLSSDRFINEVNPHKPSRQDGP